MQRLFAINQERNSVIAEASGQKREYPTLAPISGTFRLEKLLEKGSITVSTNFDMRLNSPGLNNFIPRLR